MTLKNKVALAIVGDLLILIVMIVSALVIYHYNFAESPIMVAGTEYCSQGTITAGSSVSTAMPPGTADIWLVATADGIEVFSPCK